MYVVHVNVSWKMPPTWDFRHGFFPRKVRYKKDAIDLAKEAVQKGASMARVECPGGGELDYRPQSNQ